MLNARSIQSIIILVIGVFLAVWLGLSIATNQVETIIQVIAALVLIGCLFLGRKVWLLIPFAAALNIGLRIPGQPDSLLLAEVLVLGFSLLFFLMRKLPYKFAWTELELWILILTLFVAQVYVRNPVGVNIFGGDTVGGKPYAIYVISLVAALFLAGIRVPVRELGWILRISIIGGILNAVVSIIGMISPVVGFYTGAQFVRADEVNYENMGKAVDTGAATRVGFLTNLGRNLSLWISCYISPIRACLHPLWAVLVLLSLAAVMLGGFRNGVAAVGLTYLIGIAYRSGSSGVVVSAFGAIAGIVLLAIVNLISPLPPNAQRALAFLPGTWEQRYKIDTADSNEWRFEIWREALTSERWIRNKWLGDGLGFSAEDFRKSFTLKNASAIGGLDLHREQVLINGDYHSGPVSTIRTIGYAGLLVLLLAQIRLGVHAHRQILRCKGTEWFSLALFLGIPTIWAPIFFVFIFGDFKSGATSLLLTYGMLRLLQNNLPLAPWTKPSIRPYLLSRNRQSKPA